MVKMPCGGARGDQVLPLAQFERDYNLIICEELQFNTDDNLPQFEDNHNSMQIIIWHSLCTITITITPQNCLACCTLHSCQSLYLSQTSSCHPKYQIHNPIYQIHHLVFQIHHLVYQKHHPKFHTNLVKCHIHHPKHTISNNKYTEYKSTLFCCIAIFFSKIAHFLCDIFCEKKMQRKMTNMRCFSCLHCHQSPTLQSNHHSCKDGFVFCQCKTMPDAVKLTREYP